MAVRGNATCFALSWQDVLAQLSAAEPDLQNAGEKSQVALPRTGSQLAEIVSVLLKASGDDEDVGALSKFIHQATVRRSIVVSLIQGAKERGHRAYVHLDMSEVTRKAQALPENGVPPEIRKLVPLDNSLDKIQMQKAATPVPMPNGLEDAAALLDSTKPNGVVLERAAWKKWI